MSNSGMANRDGVENTENGFAEDEEEFQNDDVYLDPNDIKEVIEIGENEDMDVVADRLMDAMSRHGGERQLETENTDEGEEEMEQDTTEQEPKPEPGVVKTSSLVFTKHEGSVFCCAVAPAGDVAATGGEDDVAYLWSTNTGEVLLTCTGHTDSVTSVCFSHDGRYLATGDMAGLLQVWDVNTKDLIWSFNIGDMEWLSWHGKTNLLMAGAASGEVWAWLLPAGLTKTLPSCGKAAKCGELTHDGKRLSVGYADGSVRVFDLKTHMAVTVPCGQAAEERTGVQCIANHPDNTITLTGSEDGRVRLINSHTGRVLSELDLSRSYVGAARSEESRDPVEAVGFCPANPSLAVIATLAGALTIYDVTTQSVRHSLHQPAGISRLCFAPADSTMAYTAGLDGCVRAYDLLAGKQTTRLVGHSDGVLDFCMDRCGTVLVSCSDDGSARVFKVES